MNRIDLILNNKTYKECMNIINQYEVDRVFCTHSMEHGINVARIAYIINLENNYGIEKSHIYAAALLHDIGRSVEYRTKQNHRAASIEVAKKILEECDFASDEITSICKAIGAHGRKNANEDSTLGLLLYRADKLSRNCFECSASAECYWEEDKKNKGIII